jgi:hypothetical protein
MISTIKPNELVEKWFMCHLDFNSFSLRITFCRILSLETSQKYPLGAVGVSLISQFFIFSNVDHFAPPSKQFTSKMAFCMEPFPKNPIMHP